MIYICIVSYKRPEILQRCITSLEPVLDRVHLLTLQQGAFDDNFNDVKFHYTLTENLGCAGGRKFLAEKLLEYDLQPDDITIWLDDDIVASGDAWLSELCAPIILNSADITGVEGMEVLPTFYTKPCGDKQPDYVSGGWCAISARVFLAGCMFDTRFNLNYWEDVDFNYQARAKGFRIAQVSNLGLHHEAHGGNPQQFEYSRAQFIAKHKTSIKD
jgi:GT2 family glycosyltransferase